MFVETADHDELSFSGLAFIEALVFASGKQRQNPQKFWLVSIFLDLSVKVSTKQWHVNCLKI